MKKKHDPYYFELRNAPRVETPRVAVCNVTKAEDVAWFFSLTDAKEYIAWKNSQGEKYEKV
jgi:hypothetical protein